MKEILSLLDYESMFGKFADLIPAEDSWRAFTTYQEMIKRGGKPYVSTGGNGEICGVKLDGADLSIANYGPEYRTQTGIEVRLRFGTKEEALRTYAYGGRILVEMIGHTPGGHLQYTINLRRGLFELSTLGEKRERMTIPTVAEAVAEILS